MFKRWVTFWISLALVATYPASRAWSESIYLPNLGQNSSGTVNAGKPSLDVNVTSPISVTQPADGPTGAAVPADASYTGGNKGGLLTGLLIGQQTMANSLACVLPSDQSAIPVSQSGTWTVQPGNTANTTPWLSSINQGGNTASVKPASTAAQATDPALVVALSPNSPIPTGSNVIGAVTQSGGPWTGNVTQFGGGAVATGTGTSGAGIPRVTVSNDSNMLATQSGTWTVQPGNTANTTPWLASISQGGNTAAVKAASTAAGASDPSVAVALSPNSPTPAGTNIIGKVGIDQTTPGTTNGVQVNAALPAGTNTIGNVKVTDGTNFMPTMDAVGRAGFHKITDGTNTAAVKAASTAAAAADPALVVSVSPNSPVPAPVNASGSFSGNSVNSVSESTFTVPANTVGIIIECPSTNATNVRWSLGTTVTTSVGMLCEPGRDTGYIPAGFGNTIHAIATAAGTNEIEFQYIKSQ